MDIPLYDRTSNGNCGFLGFRMCQNRLAVPMLSYLLETEGFAQVIELGTQLGGLSVLIALQCKMLGARFDTFDREPSSPYEEWFETFKVGFHLMDVFSAEGTEAVRFLIQSPGRVLLLCDNGNKVEEFTRFAPLLKSGDVIGAHDYSPVGGHNEEYWAWQEITDVDVETVCEQQRLVPFHQNMATRAAWLLRMKS